MINTSETFAVPAGVMQVSLKTFSDDRGELTELYNDLWEIDIKIAQWNFVRSKPSTLRGMHVHVNHTDYLCVLEGKMLLGLKDLRKSSCTFGLEGLYELSFETPEVWIIPPGIAHAFYFPVDTIYCYGLTEPWKNDHGLGCKWDSTGIDIPWPTKKPIVSPRDANAMSLNQLLDEIDHIEF